MVLAWLSTLHCTVITLKLLCCWQHQPQQIRSSICCPVQFQDKGLNSRRPAAIGLGPQITAELLHAGQVIKRATGPLGSIIKTANGHRSTLKDLLFTRVLLMVMFLGPFAVPLWIRVTWCLLTRRTESCVVLGSIITHTRTPAHTHTQCQVMFNTGAVPYCPYNRLIWKLGQVVL